MASVGSLTRSILALTFAAGVWIVWKRFRSRAEATPQAINSKAYHSYSDIEPLPCFNWLEKEQIDNASFRSTYHLTMALQSCTLSELVDFDKEYISKIRLRREVLRSNLSSVLEANTVAIEAVRELYTWIFGTYLPRRYPTMFSFTEKGNVLNRVLNEEIPLTAPGLATECLNILGCHVDTDFLILLPVSNPHSAKTPIHAFPTPNPPEPYHLHAYVLCCPSGFNTPQKFGLPLAAIHAPVPGYSQKLEKSMDRFFSTLPFGKVVKRSNWAVQTDSRLFKMDGNHLNTSLSPGTMAPPTHEPSEAELQEWEEAARNVKPEECMLRSERQTLHRLEQTGALVFAFKTFLYPLPDIKAKGLGAEMADAVDGLWKGSVPAMAVYKKGVVWGKKVIDYLRDESKSAQSADLA